MNARMSYNQKCMQGFLVRRDFGRRDFGQEGFWFGGILVGGNLVGGILEEDFSYQIFWLGLVQLDLVFA